MCMAPPGTMDQMQNSGAMRAMQSAKPGNYNAIMAYTTASAASDPSYVRSVYDKEGSSGFERKFGAYGDGPGSGAYRTLAKQQGRAFDPSDLYGEKAAAAAKEAQLNQRLSALEQMQSSRGQLGTISTSKTKASTPSTNNRTPQRVRPIRTSLQTSYGTKQIPTSSSMGLNVPN